MKKIIFILLLLTQNVFAQNDWEKDVFMSSVGSCKSNNLNFNALRFTKIPLNLDNVFLRIILFVRPDNTQAIRLTTQELLGCQTSSNGAKICSYRPLKNFWYEAHWNNNLESLEMGDFGVLSKSSSDGIYSLRLPQTFQYPEVSGKTIFGNMVLVNFDDHGVNTANLCKSSFQSYLRP